MKYAFRYWLVGLTIIVAGLLWFHLLIITGLLIAGFSLNLIGAHLNMEPVINKSLLKFRITDSMERYAEHEYGWTVEQLREEYVERFTLLSKAPQITPVVRGRKIRSPFKYREELEMMVIQSELKLQNIYDRGRMVWQ